MMTSQLEIADLAIIDAKVVTVDKDFSIAQAIAIKGEKILAVGKNDEISCFLGKDTKVIEAGGKTILPGINESYGHFAFFGGTRPPFVLELSHPAVKSIDDVARKVEEAVKAAQPGDWIQGRGWDEAYLAECLQDPKRHPTRWDLDSVSPDNPVCLGAHEWNTVWVNGKALEIAGIDARTADPTGGEIVRRLESNEPTGILREFNAQELVTRLIPMWSRDEKRKAIVSAMKELNKLGVTSITEGALGPGGGRFQGGLWDEECIDIYKELHEAGELTLRVNIVLLFGEYGRVTEEDMKRGLQSFDTCSRTDEKWVRISGVKIFADGIPPLRTAWMYREYPNSEGLVGGLVVPGRTDAERCEELHRTIRHAHGMGFQLAVHACGDRAIDVAVDGLIGAMKEQPGKDLRHYIVHADFTTNDCAQRMGEWGIGVNVQPALKYIASDFLDAVVGEERSTAHVPCRSFIDAGLHIAISSDAPVIFPDWRQSVVAAVKRISKATGKISGPEQRISREEAIRCWTIGGAYQDHMDDIKGSIEPGKMADLCVVSGDILDADVGEILSMPVVMTIVGGKVVYEWT